MGNIITLVNGKLQVPDDPIIPFIEGDGTGPDVWRAARAVIDAAVEKAYGGTRKIEWLEVLAGAKAYEQTGDWLPQSTLEALKHYKVGIKGPLETPVGGGIRSLNVAIRQELDLYACVRPVRWFEGVPSPVRHPERVNMVIFRENTEDVYAGYEWPSGSPEAQKLIAYLNKEFKTQISSEAGIGIKPMTEFASKRLIRMAIKYALNHGRSSVTLVHKGNIMKYTEGAFRDWGYDLARSEFADLVVFESELAKRYEGKVPEGKILIKDRIADNMFQQALLRPEEYDVLAMPNLNGDYLSDAVAAQVGGIGMAPGGNIGDEVAVFEATHGTAPKYANLDIVNPSSLILSGVMMLEHLGWVEAGKLIENAIAETIKQKVVTYDLARLMDDAKEVRTSEFATAIISNM